MRLLKIGAMQQQGRMASIDIDLRIYLASLTTPLSAPQIALLNTFVKDLKAGLGITRLYEGFDQMLIHANETIESGLNNLVKRAHDATLSATAPAFTALEGFTGNGSSTHILTGYNPAINADNYTLNFAAYGVYTRLNIVEVRAICGALDGTTRNELFQRNTSDRSIYAININVTPAVEGILNSQGLFTVTRPDPLSNNMQLYINKDYKGQYDVVGASAIPNEEIALLCRNDQGSFISRSTNQISFYFIGKGLDQSDIDTVYDTFQAYMTANGKQV